MGFGKKSRSVLHKLLQCWAGVFASLCKPLHSTADRCSLTLGIRMIVLAEHHFENTQSSAPITISSQPAAR
jgi:hypothetical protein